MHITSYVVHAFHSLIYCLTCLASKYACLCVIWLDNFKITLLKATHIDDKHAFITQPNHRAIVCCQPLSKQPKIWTASVPNGFVYSKIKISLKFLIAGMTRENAHYPVLIYYVILTLSVFLGPCDIFTRIRQGCFTDNGNSNSGYQWPWQVWVKLINIKPQQSAAPCEQFL